MNSKCSERSWIQNFPEVHLCNAYEEKSELVLKGITMYSLNYNKIEILPSAFNEF